MQLVALPSKRQRWMSLWQSHRFECVVVVMALVMTIGAYLIYYHLGLTNIYPDGNSKLAHARRTFDNYQGEFKLVNLGLIWLWAQSLLILPTVWISWMYHSGMSGSWISMVAYVITGLAVFEIVRTVGGKTTYAKWGGMVAASAVLFNLNFVYFSTTPMAEPLILLSTALCGLCLCKWEEQLATSPLSIKWLLLTSLSLTLAINVRYDMWFMAVFAGGLAIIILWRSSMPWRDMPGYLITMFMLPVLSMLVWMAFQFQQTGNPLYFSNGPFSAREKDVIGLGQMANEGNLRASVSTLVGALRMNMPDGLLILAVVGGLLYLISLVIGKERRLSLLYVLGVPLFFIESLYAGQSAVSVQAGAILNVRYGLPTLVTVAIMVGYMPIVVSRLPWPKRDMATKVVSVIGVCLVMGWFIPTALHPAANATVLIGYREGDYADWTDMSDHIAQEYNGGYILVDLKPPSNEPMLYQTGLDQSQFVTETYSVTWQDAMVEPLYYTDWIFVTAGGDQVSQAIAQHPDFLAYFKVSYANGYGTLYERIDRS